MRWGPALALHFGIRPWEIDLLSEVEQRLFVAAVRRLMAEG